MLAGPSFDAFCSAGNNAMTDTAFTEHQYDEAYKEGISDHYWHRARSQLIERWLRGNGFAEGKLLEVGCGTGIVLAHLRQSGIDCWGCDLGRPPIPEVLRPFVRAATGHDELDDDFRQNISGLLLLDVLEHIHDPVAFLRSLRDNFPKAKFLLLTVPARAELWSNYDEHYGHQRRYQSVALTKELTMGGFSVSRMRYFFHELYLPLLVSSRSNGRSTELKAPNLLLIHRILAVASGVLSALLPPRLPGSSLIAIARPQGDVCQKTA